MAVDQKVTTRQGTAWRSRPIAKDSAAKKDHILMIVQNLPVPFDRRVWQEATSLSNVGYAVTVICPKKKIYKKAHERLNGVEIYRYPLVIEADKGALAYVSEFLYCWLASLALALYVYVRNPFHAIHACNPPDTFFALALLFRPLKVKFVFDHHDLSPEMYRAKGRSERSILYKGLLSLERWTLKTAHSIIAVNESHKSIAMRRGGIEESKISIVRSGPKSDWSSINAPDHSLKRGSKYLVVYLGEMCEQDGVNYLLKAIAHYKSNYPADTAFALIGGGPDQERMKGLAKDMGLEDVVHFTGRIPDEMLWAYLSTADLCVDPDPYTEWSNLSTMNKVIEYMAFGKPIVAFDLLENRYSAGDAAVYVEPNSAEKFSESIRLLLKDTLKRETMSAFGKQRFKSELAWEKSSEKLVDRYKTLLRRDG